MCRQLCLLFPNFKSIRTFPAKLTALTVMCVWVYLPSHSLSSFPYFPTHTHTDTESTHTGQRQADFIYRHYMYPTDMFLALHRFQHRHGYAEKQTHTHTDAREHTLAHWIFNSVCRDKHPDFPPALFQPYSFSRENEFRFVCWNIFSVFGGTIYIGWCGESSQGSLVTDWPLLLKDVNFVKICMALQFKPLNLMD